MSLRCMTWVFHESEARGFDRLVLLALADEADDDGLSCYPALRRLAAKARVSVGAARDAVNRLEAAGELAVWRPPSTGRGHHNYYGLVMGRPVAEVAAALEGEVGAPAPKRAAPARSDATPKRSAPARSASTETRGADPGNARQPTPKRAETRGHGARIPTNPVTNPVTNPLTRSADETDSQPSLLPQPVPAPTGAVDHWGPAVDLAPLTQPGGPKLPAAPAIPAVVERACRNRTTTRKTGDEHPAFAAWYALYPRRVGRSEAAAAYSAQVAAGADPDHLALAAACLARVVAERGEGTRYVPHPSTLLNGGGWIEWCGADSPAVTQAKADLLASRSRPFRNVDALAATRAAVAADPELAADAELIFKLMSNPTQRPPQEGAA